jgi:hypothetical protein
MWMQDPDKSLKISQLRSQFRIALTKWRAGFARTAHKLRQSSNNLRVGRVFVGEQQYRCVQ